MSFEGDAPMRTLCGLCEKWCETEGQDASPVSYSGGEAYHTACLEDGVAEEDAQTLRRFQWMRDTGDRLLKIGVSRLDTKTARDAFARGESPEEFVNGICGSLVRAGDENE